MIEYEQCGHSFLRTNDAGRVVEVRHRYWAPIQHLYTFPTLGDEHLGIPLYRGAFELDGDAWDGEIHFDTRKQPEPLASGERNIGTLAELDIAAVKALFLEDAQWQKTAVLSVPGNSGIPAPPIEASASARRITTRAAGFSIREKHVGSAEIGTGAPLDRITFLVPNGRLTSDGWIVCNGDRALPGAMSVEAEGWSIRLHPRTDAPKSAVEHRQKETASHLMTHVGEIRRSDGSGFSSTDGDHVQDVLSTALTIYLGRATACLLPVGWLGDVPVWARWGEGRAVDRRESDFSWFDLADGTASLAELIRCCLATAQRSDGLWDVVKLALGYLLSAHRSTVQMRVSLPVAAIALIAEEWSASFAPPADRRSRASMEDMGAADKFRLMLDIIEASPAVPDGLAHLEDVRKLMQASADAEWARKNRGRRNAPAGQSAPTQVDAVKCVIALRNEVEHPGKRRRVQHDIRQWAEAGFFATDALLLSVLFLVGYRGTYLPLSSPSRGAGSGRTVPWASSQQLTAK